MSPSQHRPAGDAAGSMALRAVFLDYGTVCFRGDLDPSALMQTMRTGAAGHTDQPTYWPGSAARTSRC